MENKPELNQSDSTPKPKLWNPNAAANWSLIFSPAFGAILQAKNWVELGQPDKAKTNKKWAIGVIIFLVIFALLPSIRMLDLIGRGIALILLIMWYFSQGRVQVKFVKEKYGQEYENKKWTLPLLIGTGCIIGLIILMITGVIYAMLFGVPLE